MLLSDGHPRVTRAEGLVWVTGRGAPMGDQGSVTHVGDRQWGTHGWPGQSDSCGCGWQAVGLPRVTRAVWIVWVAGSGAPTGDRGSATGGGTDLRFLGRADTALNRRNSRNSKQTARPPWQHFPLIHLCRGCHVCSQHVELLSEF